jgi:hypothetical protein
MIRLLAGVLALIAISAPAATEPPHVSMAPELGVRPPLSRLVTLYVPDTKPVRLLEALRAIARQTGAVIRLDADVAQDIQFSGRFTRTPLSLVLDTFAKTGAFKWFAERDGTLRVAAHDDLLLRRGTWRIAGEACAACKRPLDASWRYCPWCGHAVVRATDDDK